MSNDITLVSFSVPDVQEIFETQPDTGDDYKTALEKLNEYFKPKKYSVFRQAFGKPLNSQTNQWMHLSLDYVV